MSAALRVLLLGLALAGTAWAHRLHVEARLEAGRVRVEVYFSDGTAPAGAEVVATREGAEVARGATDGAGVFTFVPPVAGRYAIAVVEPGLHRGRVEVEVAPADLAAPAAVATASVATAATTGPARGGGDDWKGTLAGLAAIAALALGLAWWQRRTDMQATA